MAAERIIMHVDVNSAFLSWSNLKYMKNGGEDLRKTASAVAGDPNSRHGIILAKSMPAKTFGVSTGEPIAMAKRKCPSLVLVPPDYQLYIAKSNELGEIVSSYSPIIEQYSIDEFFIDYTGLESILGSPIDAADRLREQVERELGFTVNVGIGNNKLLAKMAGELKKPNFTHTIFKSEIEKKMWPLPLRELFMLGASSEATLKAHGIETIGQLAALELPFMYRILKSQGALIWSYANGIDTTPVVPRGTTEPKSISNSVSTPHDISRIDDALAVLSQLCDSICVRMRNEGFVCNVVTVAMRDTAFATTSKQQKLDRPSDVTSELMGTANKLFRELWQGKPIRQVTIGFSDFLPAGTAPSTLFDTEKREKMQQLDEAFDKVRLKYGSDAIKRAGQLNNFEIDHLDRYSPNSKKPKTNCPF